MNRIKRANLISNVVDYGAFALVVYGLYVTLFSLVLGGGDKGHYPSICWASSHPAIVSQNKAHSIDLSPIFLADVPVGNQSALNATTLGEHSGPHRVLFSPFTQASLKGHVTVLFFGLVSGEHADGTRDPDISVPRGFSQSEGAWLHSLKRLYRGDSVREYFVRVNNFGSQNAALLDPSFLSGCAGACVNGYLMMGPGPTNLVDSRGWRSVDAAARQWVYEKTGAHFDLSRQGGADSDWPMVMVFDSQGRLRYASNADQDGGGLAPLSLSQTTLVVNVLLAEVGRRIPKMPAALIARAKYMPFSTWLSKLVSDSASLNWDHLAVYTTAGIFPCSVAAQMSGSCPEDK